MAAGVHDAIGEVAVVGQQQQSLRVLVQPSHRVDTLFHVLQQIHHTPPVQFVRSCGHIAPWFVQHQIAILFLSGQIHPFTADGNQVCQRSLVPQLDRVTVQLYFSGRDQLFCLPPGTIAGICQQLLNSNFFHFRFFSFFIFCSIRFHQLCCCGAADFF